ncbi:MAG: transposase, partial [Planctomycetes bacterium]|nr:transposase [Planctomycetota bacterium]
MHGPPKRRRIRLSLDTYTRVGCTGLFTVCTNKRQPVLTAEPLCETLGRALRQSGSDLPAALLVWCVMPDHIHLLLQNLPGGDLVQWIARFKGRVAKEARAVGLRNLWQRGFHDRLLRKEEDLVHVARYVLENPV